MGKLAEAWILLKGTFREFSEDNCLRMGAALAYYTIFSLPPVLVIAIAIASIYVDPATVKQTLEEEVGSVVGEKAAGQVGEMLSNAKRSGHGPLASLVGIGVLLFAATSAVVALQDVLNTAWDVRPDPKRNAIWTFFTKRLVSVALVLGLGFLLLVSLVVSMIVSALSKQIGRWLANDVTTWTLFLLDNLIALAAVTVLFAALFKYLPDAKIAWRDVWIGAVVTGVLFVVGKFLLGFYLGRTNPGSTYGTAGSLVLILIWIYYSSLILLFGAEFTQVWARHHGKRIEPQPGAVRAVKELRTLDDSSSS